MEEEKNNQTPMSENQTSENKEKNTGMAILAYILFFVPLLTDAKNDPFVKYHVKQGLVLFIAWLVVSLLTPILFMITWILYLGLVVLMILGIMNAANSKKEPLPLIGQFADRFNF